MSITLEKIRQAQFLISGHIHRTPVLNSTILNELTNSSLHFKCENFQKTGSFKARGAGYSVLSLPEAEAQKGIVAHTSGNHGGALAWAGKNRGIPVTVVVPHDAPTIKLDAMAYYGAEVVRCEPNMQARESTAEQIVAETQANYIPPFNSYTVIAGQGTLGLEILADIKHLDTVIVPVGGGGLISGVAAAIKSINPAIEIIGVEPVAASSGAQSLVAGVHQADNQTPLKTVADGLAASIGSLTFPLIQQYVDDILIVTDDAIVDAMQLIWTRMKIIVEPAASAALAAVIQHPERFCKKEVALVMTGGNLDLGQLPWQER